MIMVEIDSSAILVKPMKNQKDAVMIRAYNALMLRLKRVGISPQKHVMDDKVSEKIESHIRDNLNWNLSHLGVIAKMQQR